MGFFPLGPGLFQRSCHHSPVTQRSSCGCEAPNGAGANPSAAVAVADMTAKATASVAQTPGPRSIVIVFIAVLIIVVILLGACRPCRIRLGGPLHRLPEHPVEGILGGPIELL